MAHRAAATAAEGSSTHRRHISTTISSTYHEIIVTESERSTATSICEECTTGADAVQGKIQGKRRGWSGVRNVFYNNDRIGEEGLGDLVGSSVEEEGGGKEGQEDDGRSKRRASRRLTETLTECARQFKRRVSIAFSLSKRKDSFVPLSHGDVEYMYEDARDDVWDGMRRYFARRENSLDRRVANYPYPAARGLYAEKEAMRSDLDLSGESWEMASMASAGSVVLDANEWSSDLLLQQEFDDMMPLLTRQPPIPVHVQGRLSEIMSRESSKRSTDEARLPPSPKTVLADPHMQAYVGMIVKELEQAEKRGSFEEDVIDKRFAQCGGATTSLAKQSRACCVWRQKAVDPAGTRASVLDNCNGRSRSVPSSASIERTRSAITGSFTEQRPTTESVTREQPYPWRWLDDLTVRSTKAWGASSQVRSLGN